MPTYEFECPAGHVSEKFFRTISTGVAEIACPTCGNIAHRRMSGGAGLVFKGSGFYLTDYGRDAHRGTAPAAEGGRSAEGAPGDGKATETKASETKGSETKGSGTTGSETTGSESKGADTKRTDTTRADGTGSTRSGSDRRPAQRGDAQHRGESPKPTPQPGSPSTGRGGGTPAKGRPTE